MIKAEKKTLKLSVEKPQYITVNDITYAQVDSWFGHCRRDLKLDIIYPETKDGKIEDPEYYTRLSFLKLTRNETFPKGLFGSIKMMFVNFFKSFTNWKNILKRVGLCVLMSVLTLIWNLYALCYLNDTFNINIRAVFGKLRPICWRVLHRLHP